MFLFTVLARDEKRCAPMKAILRAYSDKSARDFFAEAFPPPRYSVVNAQLTIPLELSHPLDDGTTVADCAEACPDVGVVFYAADLE